LWGCCEIPSGEAGLGPRTVQYLCDSLVLSYQFYYKLSVQCSHDTKHTEFVVQSAKSYMKDIKVRLYPQQNYFHYSDEEYSPLIWVFVSHKKMAFVWVSAQNISLLTWLLEVTNLWNAINFVQAFTAIMYLQPQLTKFPIYTLALRRHEVTRSRAGQNYESMH